MDGYSHAYPSGPPPPSFPSAHKRSRSTVTAPPRRRTSFKLASVQSEPFVLFAASSMLQAFAATAVRRWALERGGAGISVVLPCAMLAGGLWGVLRGRARTDLIGSKWPSLAAFTALLVVQYSAFFYALKILSPLRLAIFVTSTDLWASVAQSPTASTVGSVSLATGFLLSLYSSLSSLPSSSAALFSHLALTVYIVSTHLREPLQRSLSTHFAGSNGSGLDTLRTVAMFLSALVLCPLSVFISLLNGTATSVTTSAFSLPSVYAVLAAASIVAHPSVLLNQASVQSGPESSSAVLLVVGVTSAIGAGLFKLFPSSWDLCIAAIVWFAAYCLPPPPKSAFNASNASTSTSAPSASSTHRLMRTYLKTILDNPESRKIYYFLLLNLAYMLVQMVWGIWSGSLGLISDAIHMFFDCLALGVGLFASVMATWKSDEQFTYGYGRVETLSGFANGVFLILISIFIIFEAVQRIADPPEMETNQLLLVSSVGLGINLFGMFATGGHAHHGHSHGGHSHSPSASAPPPTSSFKPKPSSLQQSHSHDHDDGHAHTLGSEKAHSHGSTSDCDGHEAHEHGMQGHDSHDRGHSHEHKGPISHGDEHAASSCGHDHDEHEHDHDYDHKHDQAHESHSHNMRGVFLHVLADTMGSVGVIISTLLIGYTGWTGWDPVASLFIAGLIIASVVPLVIDSGKVLCLDVGSEREANVRQALSELVNVEGVASYGAARFWPKDESTMVGSIHIHLARISTSDPGRPSEAAAQGYYHPPAYANVERVTSRVNALLRKRIRGLAELSVQVEGGERAFCSCLTG